MKTILPILAVLILTISCSQEQNQTGHQNERIKVGYRVLEKVCIEGVTYLVNYQGKELTVMLNKDSKIIECSNHQ